MHSVSIPIMERISFPLFNLDVAIKSGLKTHSWATQEDIEAIFWDWYSMYMLRLRNYYHISVAYYRSILEERFPTEFQEYAELQDSGEIYKIEYSNKIVLQSLEAVKSYREWTDQELENHRSIQSINEDEPMFVSGLDAMYDLVTDQRRYHLYGLWEPWFNYVIDNSPDIQSKLSKIPYSKYLRSEHWRKVRGAIMIAYNRKCWQKECYGADDPAWSYQMQYKHVHHLNYKNRGNERYADLVLICDRHHKMLHDGKIDKPFQIIQKRPLTPILTGEELEEFIGEWNVRKNSD